MARIDEVLAELATLKTENAETLAAVQEALARQQEKTDALIAEVARLTDLVASGTVTDEDIATMKDKVAELKGEQDQLQEFLGTVGAPEPEPEPEPPVVVEPPVEPEPPVPPR